MFSIWYSGLFRASRTLTDFSDAGSKLVGFSSVGTRLLLLGEVSSFRLLGEVSVVSLEDRPTTIRGAEREGLSKA